MFEVRFSFQRSQSQTVRIDVRPEQVVEATSEREALRLLANPPMVRELAPLRFVKRRMYR